MDTTVPLSTYRLQLTPFFDFYRASRTCGYLRDLGISHLYLSPCLAAVHDSPHGYDVVDPSRVNPQLGGQDGFDTLCRALRETGLGLVLDLVPNHMAIGARANRWWWDVLANGRASRYAGYFDIRWDSPGTDLRNKVLVPILRDEFERCLQAREIQLRQRGEEIHVGYFDHELPASAVSLMELQRVSGAALSSPESARSAGNGAVDNAAASGAEGAFGEDAATKARDAAIKRINSDPSCLKRFLDLQHYRLAFWRHAHRELNYRRFFDIHHLAGIRVEEEQVFTAVHAMVLRWVQEGRIGGLRIDHPDGLRDPTAYLQQLRKAAPAAWIVVEKILAPGEALNPEWPVEGSTGYDFLNVLSGLFIDPNGKRPLTDFYHEFTGQTADYEEVVRAKKVHVLKHLFISELSRLTDLLENIHRRRRDRLELRRQDHEQALAEVIAGFPVYRTYIRPDVGRVEDSDRIVVQETLAVAAARRPDIAAAAFRTMEDILLLRRAGEMESDFVLRFQQLTGPVMAKGVEDTVFYCFNRLLSLNEVGGDPGKVGTSPDTFHAFCARVQSERPLTLLASATHDTKRGEDTRLRIGLLSEMPGRWAEAVRRWSRMNAVFRRNGFPDANSEYFLYQTLVGAWPIGGDRLGPYMLKATREAKVHTSWTDPNPVFEEALQGFIEGVLGQPDFTTDLSAFLKSMVKPAMITSLAQILIKCTAPGIPDIYQGAELWDLSLVDPDNRRPVDFDRRSHLLSRLACLSLEEILEPGTGGMAKLYVIQRALNVRRRLPEAFGPQGVYQPLRATGPKASHAVAYVRGERCLTVAPRLVVGLGDDWGETWLELPAGVWTNAFTGERWTGGRQAIGSLLSQFPVGLWLREEEDEG
ncbi:MAG: malto-oligosyltrehalose synthase [Deltaproteobacteria bacterium]|nr:malto-oligosyltrehalose synthase [Deltaproteobacteria bacterium]